MGQTSRTNQAQKGYNPPIPSRSTKELLAIVEKPDDWKPDALKMTRKELVKRGYSIEQQKNRRKSTVRYKKRVSKIKANASYSTWERVAIFLMAPTLLTPTYYCGEFFWHLKSDGYSKMWKQKLALEASGILAWFLVLYVLIVYVYK